MANKQAAPEPITDDELVWFRGQINSALLSRFIARVEADAKRIAELTRKGEDLCQFAGTLMLAARRVLGIDRAPYQPESGMDSFSPDAKVLYELITHPSAAGYAEAITAKDARIAELEHEVSVYLKRIDEAQARSIGGWCE